MGATAPAGAFGCHPPVTGVRVAPADLAQHDARLCPTDKMC